MARATTAGGRISTGACTGSPRVRNSPLAGDGATRRRPRQSRLVHVLEDLLRRQVDAVLRRGDLEEEAWRVLRVALLDRILGVPDHEAARDEVRNLLALKERDRLLERDRVGPHGRAD